MEKKNFLFVSIDALISDIAWQVTREGHEAKYFIENPEAKDISDGFVPKTENWEQDIAWADVIVFDDVLGQGIKAKKVRDEGKKVIGGSPYTDKLEDDRAFGQEELKGAGIPILPHKEFTSFDEAIDYVRGNPNKYVIKPSGEAQNIKRLLFVGAEENGDDVIRILEAYKKTWSEHIKVFQLQRKVTGVEVAIGAFFNGSEFIYPLNVNFEHKKLFPGNIGPATGEMGTSMFWSGPNKIFTSTIKKMEPKLKEEGYVGYVDVNFIVNNNGIYPLEFTCRFGYPTISIQKDGILTPISEVLYELASGSTFKLKTKKGFQVGVRVVVPPFPYKDPETMESYSKGATITFKKPELDGIHIEDVKMVNDQWVITGESGVALIVVGTGQTMRQAQQQAYRRISNILIPNMYYRTDIGDRWVEDSDRLNTWSYLREA
ncbi:MAG: phosphoribosylglycinamide synthetase C domain-containing protein [Candidatus Micrarchaeota archaeon]